MKIEIQSEVEIDDEDLDNQIIEAAAASLLGQLSLSVRYGESGVREKIQEKIDEILEDRIAAALDREVRAVDRFGIPVEGKEPTTLAEMVAEAADEALTQTVNQSGKAEKKTAYNYAVPRLQYLLSRVACQEVSLAAEKAAREVNAAAKAAVEDDVAKAIAKHLTSIR